MKLRSRAVWNWAGWAFFAANAAITMAIVAGPASAASTEKFLRDVDGARQVVDHTAWDRLLKSYVIADKTGLNRVRYKAFKDGGQNELKAYIKSLEAVRPITLTRNEQFAYWVNLYNAKTIDVVLDAYPIESIRDISITGGLVDFFKRSIGKGGPWKAKVVVVDGVKLSLDDIEHGILRKKFKDPRVHYAVNCASVGCPNLQRSSFTGAKLEAMLNTAAKAYINSPRGFDVNGGGITASSIYNWFASDFGGTEPAVLRHAAKYAEPELKAKLLATRKIADYAYDWSLNDAK